jgi:Regulator of chromosome condensation (RCC1) repeat/HYR domain
VQVSGLSGVQAIAAGESYSLALKNDGSVWAWGRNGNGQLGDGTNAQSNTPVQVSDLSDVQAIAAGGHHSMALRDDGSVWVWGFPENSNTPVQVSGLSDVQAIAAGGIHSLAIGSFDVTGPVISGMPSDITEGATSSAGAVVNYTNPTAADAVDGSVDVNCTPDSGSTFSLGDTTVSCTATDAAGNTAEDTFKVSVTYAWSGTLQPINGGTTTDRTDDTSSSSWAPRYR